MLNFSPLSSINGYIMKKKTSLFMSFLVIFSFACNLQAASKVEPLTELSQFINVRDFTVYKSEAYFTAQDVNEQRSVIVKTVFKNNQWGDFEIMSFSGQYRDIEPFITADGLRLYFASNRPVSGKEPASHYDIWYLQRQTQDLSWSEPIHLIGAVNTEHNEFYPVVTANKNLYFTSDRDKVERNDDIYMSRWLNGYYQAAQPLSDNINSTGYEFNAYVAADESFLIYTVYAAVDGLGSGDLYISYRQEDGRFSPRMNLGPGINSDKMDYCAFYDADNSRLIWTSKRSAVGNQVFTDLSAFNAATQQYENGQSRLYQTPFKPQLIPMNTDKK